MDDESECERRGEPDLLALLLLFSVPSVVGLVTTTHSHLLRSAHGGVLRIPCCGELNSI